MLKKFKNVLLDELLAAGLDVEDFATSDTHDGATIRFKITHAPTALSFHLIQPIGQTERFWVSASRYVGSGNKVDSVQRGAGLRTIAQASRHFRNWLTSDVLAAIEDSAVPDMWAEARDAQIVTGFWRAGENTFFTPVEREQIKAAVSTFRIRLIEAFGPNPAQMQTIDERLSYLKTAVDRLNRFDWQGVALSTLIGIATNLSLDTEKGRVLWGLFQQAISAVWRIVK